MDEVIVVGGGPTGFVSALGLARAGVRLTVIESEATINKRLIFHANGGGPHLEEALVALRRLPTDREFLLQRLMFLKALQTPPLLAQS
jgi:2-polyprenyl-6-methoxyphenol hydroxylase-like FAD-dependent oxidoreductase